MEMMVKQSLGLFKRAHSVGKMSLRERSSRHPVLQNDRSKRPSGKLHTDHTGDPRDSSECPRGI